MPTRRGTSFQMSSNEELIEGHNCSTSSKSRSSGSNSNKNDSSTNKEGHEAWDDRSTTTTNSRTKKKKVEHKYVTTADSDDGVRPHDLVPRIPAHRLKEAYTLTCIAALMSPYPPKQFFSFIVLRLLKIVCAVTHNGKQFIPYNFKSNKGVQNSSQFSRIFLFGDAYSPEGQCCYLIEEKAKNEKLWKADPNNVHDGNITIGSTIAIRNPGPITQFYAGDVPMMETRGFALAFKDPK